MIGLSYPAKQSIKRGVWRALSTLSHPRVSFLLDRQNPVPPYSPGEHLVPQVRSRFCELLAARRAAQPILHTDDIDVLYLSCSSREFVARVEQSSFVDPLTGWAVAGLRPLRESHSQADFAWHPTGRRFYRTLPSISDLAGSRLRGAPRLKSGISLLDPLAGNYAHFFDVIVNRIRLADEAGLSGEPLLVARHVAETGFCQALMAANPEIASRIVVLREPAVVETLYLVRAAFDTKDNYDYARSLLPAIAPGGSDRLLLVRGKAAVGRGFLNHGEVVETCRRFGYQPYDPAEDPLERQVARFAAASHVVSAHGAGLANLMFRTGMPCKVIEIFHRGIIRDPFCLLSSYYGFDYDAVTGPAPSDRMTHAELTTKPFQVDLGQLESRLEAAG